MSVGRRLRYEILRRDAHTCRYCGAQAPDVKLTVDHVVPVALGGSDAPTNLVTACADCNGGKSSIPADAPLVEGVADDAIRWAAAMKLAAAEQAGSRARRNAYCIEADEAWFQWTYTHGDEVRYFPRPADAADTFAHFFDVGLEIEVVKQAIDKAIRKRGVRGEYGEWNYMCGICWRTLDQRQQIAREVIEGEV